MTPAISTSSPGSKPCASSALMIAHPAQAALDVRERLVVVEVVAHEQPLDAVALDAEDAVVDALDAGSRGSPPGRKTRCSTAGHVLERDERRRRHGAAQRHAAQQLERELVGARAGRRGGDEHRHVVAEALAPLRRRPRGLLRRARGRPSRAPAAAAAPPAARSCARSSASIVAWLATGSEPSSGARSRTCTSSRVRSTWARKSWPRPAPSLAPSMSPGMSATMSWRSGPSSVPSTGSSVVNG